MAEETVRASRGLQPLNLGDLYVVRIQRVHCSLQCLYHGLYIKSHLSSQAQACSSDSDGDDHEHHDDDELGVVFNSEDNQLTRLLLILNYEFEYRSWHYCSTSVSTTFY
jgi:hypothetical protein